MIVFAKAMSKFLKKLVAFLQNRINAQIDAENESVVRKHEATERGIKALQDARERYESKVHSNISDLVMKSAELEVL